MSQTPFYITTPIYYVNGEPHIGTAYTTVAADTIARFNRLDGQDVHFLTGLDEHGQKIAQSATEHGMTPQQWCDSQLPQFQELWRDLDITNDDFIRTTQPRHMEVVQKIFKTIYDKGDIYKSEYEGYYCTPCETFFTERQLVDGNCPDCGRPTELIKEESYFFKMSKYQDQLLQYIEDHPDFIQPVARRNEMISFIKQGLEDLCISRTTFDWGIPVPIDDKHVIYVWFDALTNYISALGYGTDNDELYQKFWPADIHLVGKDIARFHAIIWPCILMAAGLPLPKQVFGHGWVLLNSGKMSKSKGEFLTVSLLESKGYDPLVYRLFCLQSHYRKNLVFSYENLDNAAVTYNKLIAKIAALKPNDAEPLDQAAFDALKEKFLAALNNDLNTSLAITAVYDVLKYNTNDQTKLTVLADFDRVLSLDLIEKAAKKRKELAAAPKAGAFTVISESGESDPAVEALIQARQDAKKAKNFAEADRIRDELKAQGIELTDVPGGAKWKRA